MAHGIMGYSELSPYDGPVFHYTTSQGLLGIVSSGQLRASEASSLNDLAEITLGWRAIDRWLADQPNGPAIEYLSRPRRDPQHQVFVLSGTSSGDDANQWRLYADQGRGYAIELDGSVPMGVVSLDPAERVREGRPSSRVTEFVNVIPWHRVLYRGEDLDRAMRALVVYTDQELASIRSTTNSDEAEHLGDILAEQTEHELQMIAHLFKAKGFVGEEEVRLVARFMWFGKHVGYRAGAYGIAGHVHLTRAANGAIRRVVPVPDMSRSSEPDFVYPVPIVSVRLGPLVHKGNKETVKAFLAAHGLTGASVKRSKVPLR